MVIPEISLDNTHSPAKESGADRNVACFVFGVRVQAILSMLDQ
jgi:hypothetical protein